jgi:hypothetical protein
MHPEIPYRRKFVKRWNVIIRAFKAGTAFYYDGSYFNAKSPLEAQPTHYGKFLQMDFSDEAVASVECIFLDEFIQISFEELEFITFILKFRIPEQIAVFSWEEILNRKNIPTLGPSHPQSKSVTLKISDTWAIISKYRDPENITLQDAWEIIWQKEGDDYL